MTTASPGYYSIVQYCPDASRLEALNLGVVLYSPAAHFLKARFGKAKTSIQKVFGEQDWDFIAMQENAVQSRLMREVESLEDLAVFVSKRANAVTLTPPRPMKLLQSPEQELDLLFERLVHRTHRQPDRRTRLSATILKSVRAVQGEYLRDFIDPQNGTCKLVVISKFGRDQESAQHSAQHVLAKHGVAMYPFDTGLDALIARIRAGQSL